MSVCLCEMVSLNWFEIFFLTKISRSVYDEMSFKNRFLKTKKIIDFCYFLFRLLRHSFNKPIRLNPNPFIQFNFNIWSKRWLLSYFSCVFQLENGVSGIIFGSEVNPTEFPSIVRKHAVFKQFAVNLELKMKSNLLKKL